MPTYDYRCKDCGHEWERFQPITANPIRKCPDCGKLKAERVIGPGAGIIFKGSGFYQTDYRSESYRKGAEAERKAAEKSNGESDGSSKKEGTKSDSGTAGDTGGGKNASD